MMSMSNLLITIGFIYLFVGLTIELCKTFKEWIKPNRYKVKINTLEVKLEAAEDLADSERARANRLEKKNKELKEELNEYKNKYRNIKSKKKKGE